jgi:hypothetical protein
MDVAPANLAMAFAISLIHFAAMRYHSCLSVTWIRIWMRISIGPLLAVLYVLLSADPAWLGFSLATAVGATNIAAIVGAKRAAQKLGKQSEVDRITEATWHFAARTAIVTLVALAALTLVVVALGWAMANY